MIENDVLSIKDYLTRMVSKILKVYRQNEPTFAAKLIGFEPGPDAYQTHIRQQQRQDIGPQLERYHGLV